MADETEQRILDAALKVFSQKGYGGAKTKTIAEESGFSEVTLFNRFNTGRAVFNQEEAIENSWIIHFCVSGNLIFFL